MKSNMLISAANIVQNEQFVKIQVHSGWLNTQINKNKRQIKEGRWKHTLEKMA